MGKMEYSTHDIGANDFSISEDNKVISLPCGLQEGYKVDCEQQHYGNVRRKYERFFFAILGLGRPSGITES